MKKYLYLFLLATIAFLGCQKEENEEDTMDYSTIGLSNVTYKFEKLSIPIELKYLSGPQEELNLTVTGLPAGMKFALSTTLGTPSFATNLELTNIATVPIGIYPLKFSATTNSGKSKTIDFDLIVEEKCSETLKGRYSCIWNNDESMPYIVYIKTFPVYPNRIYFHFYNHDTAHFYAEVDCDAGTLTLPSQPYNGSIYQMVSGNGLFKVTPNSMLINLIFGEENTIPVKFTEATKL